MEEELENDETYDFDSETVQGMEESENELLEDTVEENELRPKPPKEETKNDTKKNNTNCRLEKYKSNQRNTTSQVQGSVVSYVY